MIDQKIGAIRIDNQESHFNPIRRRKKNCLLNKKKQLLQDFSILNTSSIPFFNRPNLSYTKISSRTNEGSCFNRNSFSYKYSNIDQKQQLAQLEEMKAKRHNSVYIQKTQLLKILEIISENNKLIEQICGQNEEIETLKQEVTKVVGQYKYFIKKMNDKSVSKQWQVSQQSFKRKGLRFNNKNILKKQVNSSQKHS